MKNFIINKDKRWISIISIIVMIIIWELLSLYYNSDFILPTPWKTLIATINLLINKDFIFIAGSTILRGTIGFAIASLLGISIGIISGINKSFNAFLAPVLVVIRSVPVIAITLLALIWFRSNYVPVFIGILTMFPIICTNIIEGMKNVEPNLIEMAKLYKVEHFRIIKEIYIPAITPFIFSGISSALGIGWRAIIVGEVLSQPQYGIGTIMHSSQTYLNVDILIAWTVIAILISYCFEILISILKNKIIIWDK